MVPLHTNPLFARPEPAERVLVAGAGGFDIYAGLPVALSLFHQGKHVQLANLSFSALEGLPRESRLAPDVAVITPETALHQACFPERTLAQWLGLHGYPSTVHAFSRVGVQPLRAAYRTLIEKYDIDAVVLVDGGTDILRAVRARSSSMPVAHAQHHTPDHPGIVNGRSPPPSKEPSGTCGSPRAPVAANCSSTS
ncbi:hypothetical protein GCM10015535_52850 [Streptomyces gelaticus]|uniref:DUF1152 domain-containing protein n=1 Tax=Streptomyces gelaticus TaxID=285446 RepID=A0ABQ2W558_9ACTN|nr:hypothetical protein GCM10015535_52850 [Streptomyces gelaticus]